MGAGTTGPPSCSCTAHVQKVPGDPLPYNVQRVDDTRSKAGPAAPRSGSNGSITTE